MEFTSNQRIPLKNVLLRRWGEGILFLQCRLAPTKCFGDWKHQLMSSKKVFPYCKLTCLNFFVTYTSDKPHNLFFLQNVGVCASSANASLTYGKYGPSKTCAGNGTGGPWANNVYQITSTPSTGRHFMHNWL